MLQVWVPSLSHIFLVRCLIKHTGYLYLVLPRASQFTKPVITTAQSNTIFFALHKTDLLLKLRINIFKWWVQISSRILFHNFVLLNCAQGLYRRLSLYIIWRRLGNKSWSPCSSTKIKNSLDAFSKSVAFTLTAHMSTIKMITSLPNLCFLWS